MRNNNMGIPSFSVFNSLKIAALLVCAMVASVAIRFNKPTFHVTTLRLPFFLMLLNGGVLFMAKDLNSEEVLSTSGMAKRIACRGLTNSQASIRNAVTQNKTGNTRVTRDISHQLSESRKAAKLLRSKRKATRTPNQKIIFRNCSLVLLFSKLYSDFANAEINLIYLNRESFRDYIKVFEPFPAID